MEPAPIDDPPVGVGSMGRVGTATRSAAVATDEGGVDTTGAVDGDGRPDTSVCDPELSGS